ncbi:hypothetical protein D0469_05370 [Peribacillus saganii]|uniref:Uncharacterized protein n=1 Tax=Peribacillus saganii TaxID=2303992 RepID=A0A372LSF9_9BACI|nr:hypothetical protein D0469_05370 [Peribacillus saganii]
MEGLTPAPSNFYSVENIPTTDVLMPTSAQDKEGTLRQLNIARNKTAALKGCAEIAQRSLYQVACAFGP